MWSGSSAFGRCTNDAADGLHGKCDVATATILNDSRYSKRPYAVATVPTRNTLCAWSRLSYSFISVYCDDMSLYTTKALIPTFPHWIELLIQRQLLTYLCGTLIGLTAATKNSPPLISLLRHVKEAASPLLDSLTRPSTSYEYIDIKDFRLLAKKEIRLRSQTSVNAEVNRCHVTLLWRSSIASKFTYSAIMRHCPLISIHRWADIWCFQF